MAKGQISMPGMGGKKFGGPSRFAPGKKAKDAKGTLLRIIKLYMRFGRSIFLAMTLTGFSCFVSVSIPYFVGKTFNTFDVRSMSVDYDRLVSLLFIIIGLYFVNYLIASFNGVVMLRVSQRLVFVLRSQLFEKMQRLPLKFYDETSHGDTMSRITNDVDNISSTISQTTTQLISSVLTLLLSLFVMLSLNIYLTMVVLIAVPLVGILTKFITSKSRAYFVKQQSSLGMLNGVIEESILGLKMVKAFSRQDDVLCEFKKINDSLNVSSTRAQIFAGFMMPLMNVINNLVFASVSIVGGILSIGYGLSIGTVVSFLSYSKQFSQPLNSIAGMFNTIASALASAERTFEVLDSVEERLDDESAYDIVDVKGDVSFCDVRFGYDDKSMVLDGVSFDVKAGQTVALVGETGAGKTTVVNLLTRFYDVSGGDILIDGRSIGCITRDSLRRCFSVVLQDTCLFSGSIMDNIRYSKGDASDDDVINAAKIACAHEFISKLEYGYDTMVCGSVDNLSQGQRQLIAIARAVLCDSPILVLDEATSSVDTKTEKDIQRALISLMESRTSFLIAHRLSTIRDADCIMVVGDGRIVESGNHDELMGIKGRYYEMVVSQMGVLEEKLNKM